jgi:uncharacterized repeat protein (TIGR03803 family)
MLLAAVEASMKNAFVCTLAVILSCGFALGQAQYKVLWNFGGAGDGATPKGKLVFDRAGNLYGTTPYGGMTNCVETCGTVYELSPTADGLSETVLYKFCSQPKCADGEAPFAGLIWDPAGNLYGTTIEGGPYGGGTVFKLAPPSQQGGAWTESVLWGFIPNGAGGANPIGRLAWDSSGNLYGTTDGGGAANVGTVFELSPNQGGWTETVLNSFEYSDGGGPEAGVSFDKSGNLYGTTTRFGDDLCNGDEGCGTIFELSPGGNGKWTEKVVFVFTMETGGVPYGEVNFDESGRLYSTVSSYGTGTACHESACGGAFRMANVNGNWTYSPYFFDGPDGSEPFAGLFLDTKGQSAYGTTITGGSGTNCGNSYGCGTVFTIHGGKETVLYDFCMQENCLDGLNPWSALITDGVGNLYGVTSYGGTYNQGVAFEITP